MKTTNKRLYESIMKDVAKVVKKHLNEDQMNPNISREYVDSEYEKSDFSFVNFQNDTDIQTKEEYLSFMRAIALFGETRSFMKYFTFKIKKELYYFFGFETRKDKKTVLLYNFEKKELIKVDSEKIPATSLMAAIKTIERLAKEQKKKDFINCNYVEVYKMLEDKLEPGKNCLDIQIKNRLGNPVDFELTKFSFRSEDQWIIRRKDMFKPISNNVSDYYLILSKTPLINLVKDVILKK